MVGGFAAAGVKYVISCLWTADDFASAVLMAEFYRQDTRACGEKLV